MNSLGNQEGPCGTIGGSLEWSSTDTFPGWEPSAASAEGASLILIILTAPSSHPIPSYPIHSLPPAPQGTGWCLGDPRWWWSRSWTGAGSRRGPSWTRGVQWEPHVPSLQRLPPGTPGMLPLWVNPRLSKGFPDLSSRPRGFATSLPCLRVLPSSDRVTNSSFCPTLNFSKGGAFNSHSPDSQLPEHHPGSWESLGALLTLLLGQELFSLQWNSHRARFDPCWI